MGVPEFWAGNRDWIVPTVVGGLAWLFGRKQRGAELAKTITDTQLSQQETQKSQAETEKIQNEVKLLALQIQEASKRLANETAEVARTSVDIRKSADEVRFDLDRLLRQEILPRVWELVMKAKPIVECVIAEARRYADLNDMAPDAVEEFVKSLDIAESEKRRILSQRDKTAEYMRIADAYEAHSARRAVAALHEYRVQHQVRLDPGLVNLLGEAEKVMSDAIISGEIFKQAKDWMKVHDAAVEFRQKWPALEARMDEMIRRRLEG